MEEFELVVEGVGGFAFEDFQEQGEFSNFDGLGVDIDAKDVVEEDAFSFARCQLPVASRRLVNFGIAAFGVFIRIIMRIKFDMPIQEILIGAN